MEGIVLSFEEKKKELELKKQLAQAYHDKITTEARAIYDWALGEGMEPGEAFKLTDELYQELYDYWLHMERTNIDTQVQKFLELSWLQKHTNWDNMGREEQYELLWGLGFNSRFIHPRKMKRLIKKGTKTVLSEVIYGVERLDKEWVEMRDKDDYSHYASAEAREVAHHYKYGRY